MNILIKFIIIEKVIKDVEDNNCFIFVVNFKVNKIEIKNVVEVVYGVFVI